MMGHCEPQSTCVERREDAFIFTIRMRGGRIVKKTNQLSFVPRKAGHAFTELEIFYVETF